jgi:hypothetical protein
LGLWWKINGWKARKKREEDGKRERGEKNEYRGLPLVVVVPSSSAGILTSGIASFL